MPAAATEAARQRALDTYHIVDSLPEAAYEDIARLAATLCDAPIALVSLLDRDRQWFKARVGFQPGETPREHAVCDHAIREPDQLFEIPDLAADARFAVNPVLLDADARFYAGMPLVTPGGAPVGTVCVLDHAPRALTEAQREALASLARLTMNLMESRRREREHEVAEALKHAMPADADAPRVTVVIHEVAGLGGWVERTGERAVERALDDLEAALARGLPDGDSVTRVSGSGEFVVALHGSDAGDALAALDPALEAFQARNGVRLQTGRAVADAVDEPPTTTYLRAYERLLAARDAGSSGRAAP